MKKLVPAFILIVFFGCFHKQIISSFNSVKSIRLQSDLAFISSHSVPSKQIVLTSNTQPFTTIQQRNTEASLNDLLFFPLPFLQQDANPIIIPLRIGALDSQANNKAAQLLDNRITPVSGLEKELTNPASLLLQYNLYEKAITVVKNKQTLLPFRNLDTLTFASLTIGEPKGNTFQNYLSKYTSFQHFAVAGKEISEKESETLLSTLGNYKVVIIGLHNVNSSALQAYGISQASRTLIERLRTKTDVVLAVFGSPYSLKYFDRVENLVCAYDNNSITQKIVPQILFGAIPASGKLPVTVTAGLKAGDGVNTVSLKRLGYSIPEQVGLHSATLRRIDDMVDNYIQDGVMPGAQVLVAKNGKVVFEKAYGHLTYEEKTPVTTHTIYDLASVTKVAATLQAVMSLDAQGKLDINQKASYYLPELKNTNKEDMFIRDLLLHQAGLLAFQDHWTKTKTESGLDSSYYSTKSGPDHPVMVAPGLYGIASLKDSLWQWTLQSRLLKKPSPHKKYTFRYSDIGFDILQQVVERLAEQPLDTYLNQTFYQPLGLDELTFNPLHTFDVNNIAPTEMDNRFRGVLVRGTVHDQEAALMGGVAGHAGLFGTANDLAVLMQMNLQNGFYGGKQYLSDQIVPLFTKTQQPNNKRGLGWDKLQPGENVSTLISANAFGHTGFTGTCVWVDPDEDLIYIFLSNRVYPTVNNTKLARYKVREKIQSVVYSAMGAPDGYVAGLEK
ncbi:serine hydrolase [Rhodocytophaga rosea]|uniref:Serine hydrolase n=1 Tax=Rhodocytophaga rosea TaxID=2704465 RepID=A0A6C0GIX4_9BACT|nr:serine hydrolase [Rhodocytophaga rosea]QHT68011.1 serine hydrolase [Rhodocytophaga rosea]